MSILKLLSAPALSDRTIAKTLEITLSAVSAGAATLHRLNGPDFELLASVGIPAAARRKLKHISPTQLTGLEAPLSGKPETVTAGTTASGLMHGLGHGFRSLAAVPVHIDGKPAGLLMVAAEGEKHFSKARTDILEAAAWAIGSGLTCWRLKAESGARSRQIDLMNELSGTISSSLSIGSLFRVLATEIGRVVPYDRASLLLYEEDRDRFLIIGLDTRLPTLMHKGVRSPVEGTSAGWALRNNRPWVTFDLKKERTFPVDDHLRREGIRSTISLPLKQERMLGVFNLDSTRPSAYSHRDLDILMPAARHLAIALENSILLEAISKEKREWERTFDAIADMVWIEDFRGRVLRANRSILHEAGLSVSDVVGKNCVEILDRIGLASELCTCEQPVAEGRQSFREIRGEDGQIFHFWTYPLVSDQGRAYATVHVLKNVTDRKRLEQQLMRSDKLASLGTLVAGIAHEINNPLGIIAGYAEALLERAEDDQLLAMAPFEDFPEYLSTIHREIFRCKEILSGLLDFARPQRALIRELDINEILKEVILLVNHRARRLRHHIDMDLLREMPKISAEPGSLRQLFMNILINSMYHTPEDGHIRITSRLEPGPPAMIRVSISDTGEGIPPEVLGRIFDPFFSTKPVGEGTGLGLSIAHKIAEEHGGTIDAESGPAGGATFTVRLPAKNDEQ